LPFDGLTGQRPLLRVPTLEQEMTALTLAVLRIIAPAEVIREARTRRSFALGTPVHGKV